MQEFPVLQSDDIDKLYMRIGKNVKKAREDAGLTQLELSLILGHKSVSLVSRAEIFHKNVHFNIEHLAKIAFALEINIVDLFKGDEIH